MEVRIRGHKKPITRSRSIEFNAKVKVEEIQPVTEMAKQEELWLQDHEMAQMKERRRADVKQYKKQIKEQRAGALGSVSNHVGADAMSTQRQPRSKTPPPTSTTTSSLLSSTQEETTNANSSLNDSFVTFRGLEKYVDKTMQARKMEGWDAVLWEQEQQDLNGEYNDEQIAELYKRSKGQSSEKAQQLAQQDATDIESYLMTPRTTKLMLRRGSM